MISDVLGGPWWVVAGASLPSLASGVWVVSRWWVERGDRKQSTIMTREERLVQEVEARRIALAHEQAELFERIRTEVVRYQARLLDMERDRDKGWNLARYWNQRAHELRHAGLNAQAIVAQFCARENLDGPQWPDMTLATFEEPKP